MILLSLPKTFLTPTANNETLEVTPDIFIVGATCIIGILAKNALDPFFLGGVLRCKVFGMDLQNVF